MATETKVIARPAVWPIGRAGVAKIAARSQLRVNMTSGLISQIISGGVLAVSYPIYLHFLGFERVGLWVLLSTVQTLSYLGLFGLGPAVTRSVAAARGGGNMAAAQDTFRAGSLLLLVFGTICCITIALLRNPLVNLVGINHALHPLAAKLLIAIGILTCYSFYIQSITATLSGCGRMDLANYSLVGAKLVGLATEVALFLLGVRMAALVMGDLLTCLAQHALALFWLRRQTPIRVWLFPLPRRRTFTSLLYYGSGLFGSSLTALLLSPLSRVFLSRASGLEVVTIFDIGFNSTMQSRGLIETALRATMPEISHLQANGTNASRAGARRIYGRSVWLALALGLLMYVPLIMGAPMLLKLWLGSKFDPRIVGTFRLLAVAIYVSLLAVPAYHALIGLGRVFMVMLAQGLAGLINIVALVALYHYGKLTLSTASLAILGATVGSTLLLCIRAQWAFGGRGDLRAT